MLPIAIFLILQTIILASLILMFLNKQTSDNPVRGRNALASVLIFIVLLFGYAHGLSRIFNHYLKPGNSVAALETEPVATNDITKAVMEVVADPEESLAHTDPAILAAARAKIKVHAVITMQNGKSCAMVENRIIREGETINVVFQDQVYTWRFHPGPEKADAWEPAGTPGADMVLTQSGGL